MATKTAFPHPSAPDYSAIFNWGIKLTDYSEIFLAAGIGAHDATGAIQHEGDAVAQTKFILDGLPGYLESAGYAKNDIIRLEFTMTKDVPPEANEEIFGLFAGFFADVDVKPAAGTLRVIEALAIPGMLVEYEFWCAK
jgi:enamine deaminase RidA (YjgF/YER057c/UK114 family)